MDSYLTRDIAKYWAEAAEWDYLTASALAGWLDPHNIKSEEDLARFDEIIKNTDMSLSHYLSDTESMAIKTAKKTPIEWVRIFGKCRLMISQNLLSAMLEQFGDCPELYFYGHYKKSMSIKDLPENERDKLLRQIGGLSLLLSKQKSNLKKSNDEPNINQISKSVIDNLGFYDDVNTKGLGLASLNDSISQGLKLLKK